MSNRLQPEHPVEALKNELRHERNGRAHSPSPAATAQDEVRFLTDHGNALRLAQRCAEIARYCHPWGKWLLWDGKSWRPDQKGQIIEQAKASTLALLDQAAAQTQQVVKDMEKLPQGSSGDQLQDKLKQLERVQKWALASQDAKRLKAAVDLARSVPGIPILPEEIDRDPWLFNCDNGTLELKTGLLRPHRREDYLMRISPTPFDEEAACPAWVRFLRSVFKGDKELIEFLRRFLGLCLSGEAGEQLLTIFWGSGGNGKSTLLRVIADVLGPDYCMTAGASLLMTSKNERHPTDLTDLFGRRLVLASEPSQGCRLDEALVKLLTGGESVRARRMREDNWEFRPTHKLILATNHKPRVSGTDEGIWRRLRLVPFERRFIKPGEPGHDEAPPECRADPKLIEALAGERSGILGWLMAGCLEWQQHGLNLPSTVRSATASYRSSEDTFAQWLAECCVVGPDVGECRASELLASYKAWSEQNGERPKNSKGLGDLLELRGLEKKKKSVIWYQGIRLQGTPEQN